MKKLLVFLLAMMMVCTAACAENSAVIEIHEGEKLTLDLDGDGAVEDIYYQMIGVEYEETLQLVIDGSDGEINVFGTDILYLYHAEIVDMDGDGTQEIILSGDVGSDDYYTWCLNYDVETGIEMMLFPDAERGENTDSYFTRGYGVVMNIEGCDITLRGSQDVLGTWMCSRTFTLKDGQFELEDGGMWIMDDLAADETVWEYYYLNPITELPVRFEDGSEGILYPGEKFVPTKTDKLTVVSFLTQDGRRGTINLEENTEEGWGHKINGVADWEYFEYMPYAD